ncbi:Phosphomannomutase / Phosphoglucomutase / Phosphoglucosamine mutase, partial [hydrothermal vent metagenome]
QTDLKVSQFLADVPEVYNTPEIRVDCPDDEKFAIIEDITAFFKKDHDVIDIDGARVTFGDGWGLVRASNTQPVLVLRFEAQSMERLDELKKLFHDKLATYPSMKDTAKF